MTWALVLGGAKDVHAEAQSAITQFGEPDQIVAVKDIWIEWPRVDHVVSYHADRWHGELKKRRALGYPDPPMFWTYQGVRITKFPLPITYIKLRGGSSGLLGAVVGITVASRAVLAGIPMNNDRHYHDRRRNGSPWKEFRMYRTHWQEYAGKLRGKVKSMSGWTQELLGEPTKEWIDGK